MLGHRGDVEFCTQVHSGSLQDGTSETAVQGEENWGGGGLAPNWQEMPREQCIWGRAPATPSWRMEKMDWTTTQAHVPMAKPHAK